MGTSRRRFSREFKLEAVRMVAGGRHSLAQVARELDLRREMPQRWKRLDLAADFSEPVDIVSLSAIHAL